MAESWANFIHNFNESSRYSMKFFSVLNFWILPNFVSFCFVYDQNLLFHISIAVTYTKGAAPLNVALCSAECSGTILRPAFVPE